MLNVSGEAANHLVKPLPAERICLIHGVPGRKLLLGCSDAFRGLASNSLAENSGSPSSWMAPLPANL
jgi:hypothetical protein